VIRQKVADCKIRQSGNPYRGACARRQSTGLAFESFMPEKKPDSEAGTAEAAPHYHGHRERLRASFREAGAEALSDYKLLELLLFRVMPRRDVKPLAKALVAKFGSFAEAIAAPPARLAEVKGLGKACITDFKVVQGAANIRPATRELEGSKTDLRTSPFAAAAPCRPSDRPVAHERVVEKERVH
jgi:hypothetical protein